VARPVTRRAVDAFRTAFGVAPEIACELRLGDGIGIYGWRTPEIRSFELPANDELVLALHLGGSRRVRAITDRGLSRAQSIPGMVTILPPDRVHAFRTEGSVSVATLHLPRPMDDGPLAHLARSSAPRFAFRDRYVGAAMEALLRAAQMGVQTRPGYAEKLADALLSHLALWADTLPDEPAQGDEILSELLAWVDAHLGQKLSLDQLAARAHMSRALFTRRFRDATGLSAHQYLTRRRVEVAQRLLRDSDQDLAWIAHETGFSSQSHFTAWFREVTGSTPGRFRERANPSRTST
jgi:AraC family transcriptional regulator